MRKGLIFTLGFVIGLCLVAGFYYGYNNLSDSEIKIVKKEVKENKEPKKEEKMSSLSLNSTLVTELASNLNIVNNRTTCSMTEKATRLSEKDKLTFKDLQDEYKMFLAFRQAGVGTYQKFYNCSKINDIDKTNGICGDPNNGYVTDYNDDSSNQTTVINEQFMKIEYEKIFGEGTYKPVNYFSESDGLTFDLSKGIGGYSYSNSLKAYVKIVAESGGTCGPAPISTLTTANKKGNEIYLTERITSAENSETKFDESFKYTFELEESTGNYIFKSIEKI